MECAASTCPKTTAESCRSSTANVNAMLAIVPPSMLTKRDPKYHAKLADRSGAKPSRQVIAARYLLRAFEIG